MSFLLLESGTDLASDVLNMAQVKLAVAEAGSANTHKRDVRIVTCGSSVSRGTQPRRFVALGHQIAHARLQNRTLPRGQHFNLRRIDVHAHHAMARTRPASGAHRAHVTQTEDADRQAQILVPAGPTEFIASIVHTDKSGARSIDSQPLLANGLPRIMSQLRAGVESQVRR